MTVMMDADALETFLARDFAEVARDYKVETVTADGIRMRCIVGAHHLRPGGTVSGPTMFSLADVAVYLAILARIGPKALSVTTSAGIDFMRKPEAGRDLIVECRLLKLGRVLAVGECLIFSEGKEAPVARANLTYSIPPER